MTNVCVCILYVCMYYVFMYVKYSNTIVIHLSTMFFSIPDDCTQFVHETNAMVELNINKQ